MVSDKNNVKKFLVLGILGLFMISMIAGVVSAGSDSSNSVTFNQAKNAGSIVAGGIAGFIGSALKPLFGDKEILSRIFFALLLGMIIYSIIGNMFKKPGITWGITLMVTSLALIGLPSGFLETIRIQYGAMGAAILTLIPFIIILVFSLRTRSVLLAQVTWIFYAMYYLAMYAYEASVKGFNSASIPYLFAFIIGALIFTLVVPIRRLIFKGKIGEIKEQGEKGIEEAKLLKELKGKELTDVYGSSS